VDLTFMIQTSTIGPDAPDADWHDMQPTPNISGAHMYKAYLERLRAAARTKPDANVPPLWLRVQQRPGKTATFGPVEVA